MSASSPPGSEQTPSSPRDSRPTTQRSISRSSTWSAQETPQHHNYGTSYFPTVGSNRTASPGHRQPPSFARSVSHASSRRGAGRTRSPSVKGHRDDTGLLSEDDEDEDEESDSGETTRMRVSIDEGAVGHVDEDDDEDDLATERDEDPVTVRERQSMINVEHPFGLPIWKPALYKKSRSVTRYADQALHGIPSAQAQRLLPGNVVWAVVFGWWLAAVCFAVSGLLYFVPKGGKSYSNLIFGLGWYIVWPFGKYVAGNAEDAGHVPDEEDRPASSYSAMSGENGDSAAASSTGGSAAPSKHSTITPRNILSHTQSVSWNPLPIPGEGTSLLGRSAESNSRHQRSYGTLRSSDEFVHTLKSGRTEDWLGKACFWLALICVVAPLMLFVCLICWGLVVTIPMAKLNWALIEHLFRHPTSIRFCAAPPAVVVATPPDETIDEEEEDGERASTPQPRPSFSVKDRVLSAGQAAPAGSQTSTVLLCIYEAVGWQYYKYTVGGVNILFVNLMPLVFFVIFDAFVLLRIAERREEHGQHVPALLGFLASRPLIFLLSLLSVIPLSYFIGMAVASISAQSSIGMGAVINATFGSIIEIILYGIALSDGKGRLVEGSIIGSVLAGVLLMPGASMCSSAVRRKEQKFNAKSAGVTSTMLIMAIIGTMTPTLFYQTYGNFQLVCEGCPDNLTGLAALSKPWQCNHCYYEHPEPINDPFYHSTVKGLTFFCATILVLSYLIGMWFSLRTHASQIWQNPQQVMHAHPLDLASNRMSVYQRLLPQRRGTGSIRRKPSNMTLDEPAHGESHGASTHEHLHPSEGTSTGHVQIASTPSVARRVSYANMPVNQPAGFTPLLESVDHAIKDTAIQPMQLPASMTTDDFTRAVAVATVSALRHQHHHMPSPARMRTSATMEAEDSGGHGGHDAPSWSRTVSASVLLSCTFLYAIIAEILVDVVDVVLEGSGIDEKFLGVTLFALVPNTTEFMNAMAFALNGNIALSMEIGSAYALQVCLLQIPAMVAFSAFFLSDHMGSIAHTFTLLFPRWDVIAIVLGIFLMTYTYIEARSNYHRGSMLILSYLVLVAGFYYAPYRPEELDEGLQSIGRSALVRPAKKLLYSLFAV